VGTEKKWFDYEAEGYSEYGGTGWCVELDEEGDAWRITRDGEPVSLTIVFATREDAKRDVESSFETAARMMKWWKGLDPDNRFEVIAKMISHVKSEIEPLVAKKHELQEALEIEVDAKTGAMNALVREGHTEHCAARLAWGDGACECGEHERRAKVQEEAKVWEQATESVAEVSDALADELTALRKRFDEQAKEIERLRKRPSDTQTQGQT